MIALRLQGKHLLLFTFLVMNLAAKPFYRLELFQNISVSLQHYVELYVGSPPVKQRLYIDTGSSFSQIHCQNCLGCPSSSIDAYNPSRSRTGHLLKCPNSNPLCTSSCQKGESICSKQYGYVDGTSFIANVTEDIINFNQDLKENLWSVFACVDILNTQFSTSQGVLGLGVGQGQLINQWAQSLHFQRVITVCMAPLTGYMTFGRQKEPLSEEYSQFTLQLDEHYYLPRLTSFSLGSMELLARVNKVDFDTGGSTSVFPKVILDQIQTALSVLCSKSRECTKYPNMVFYIHQGADKLEELFPPITIAEGDSVVQFQPSDYFFDIYQNGKYFYLTFTTVATADYLNRITVGKDLMSDRKIIFDLANLKLKISPETKCIYETLNQTQAFSLSTFFTKERIVVGALIVLLMIGAIVHNLPDHVKQQIKKRIKKCLFDQQEGELHEEQEVSRNTQSIPQRSDSSFSEGRPQVPQSET